jgi:hypothetical protein
VTASGVFDGYGRYGLVVGAWSLVVRFRRASGVERQQFRWVTFAAALTVPLGAVVVAGVVMDVTTGVVPSLAAGGCLALLPLATGAAILRFRLYDLDRIFSRTLAYGLLTVLLGLGYAAVVLGFGRLHGELLAVVDRTMQPTRAWLWLRPTRPPAG